MKQAHYARAEREKAVAAKALASQFNAFGPRNRWLTRVAALIHVGIVTWFVGLTAVAIGQRAELVELRRELEGIAVSSSATRN